MSPSLHLLHHSNNPEHYECNFSMVFPFWDTLFGTYIGEDRVNEITGFGIVNSEYNQRHPLYSYFIIPIKRLTNLIVKFPSHS